MIGRRIYKGSDWAEPSGDDALSWHMRYRVREEEFAAGPQSWRTLEGPLPVWDADDLHKHTS